MLMITAGKKILNIVGSLPPHILHNASVQANLYLTCTVNIRYTVKWQYSGPLYCLVLDMLGVAFRKQLQITSAGMRSDKTIKIICGFFKLLVVEYWKNFISEDEFYF